MTEAVPVTLHRLPVHLHRQSAEHIDGLVREFQLIGNDPESTPARMLSVGRRLSRRSNAVMGMISRVVAEAAERGESHVDLHFTVPVEAAGTCRSVDELLDEADQFCREGGLLTLATPRPALEYRRWFLGEFCRQIEGEDPLPWPESPQAVALRAGMAHGD